MAQNGNCFEGRIAVVTGGGSGIGRAAALRLAEHGAKILLLDRAEQENDKVQEEIIRA